MAKEIQVLVLPSPGAPDSSRMDPSERPPIPVSHGIGIIRESKLRLPLEKYLNRLFLCKRDEAE